MPHPFRLKAIASLFAASALAASARAADTQPLVDVVVISASRVEHTSFDLPAAIDVVGAARIRDGQMRVNASEALAAVPGLVAQNRGNYAQDLQISSRGFGARSAFGVRGVRLVSDGVPASMPDGQGQPSAFNLDMAERIEVLRGPFSAIYGNHSGGVIQLFTRDGQGRPTLDLSLSAGSDSARKADISAQGASGAIGYVIDASRFETDGFRTHSAATRDQGFAKLTMRPADGGKLTLVANSLRQFGTQDPLGVSWATYQRDSRAGEIDATDTATPQRTFAERYDTRKNIEHQQIGMAYDQHFGDDRLHVMIYGGNRRVTQYQPFSKGFQAPATHSGGVVDFDRDFYGADVNWVAVRRLGGGKLTATAGIDYGHSNDDRKGYENFIGNQFGVQGALRRDEQDLLSSLDPYLQAEWQAGPWVLTAGARHTRMTVSVGDRFLVNGNDSGGVEYRHTTPVIGALYKIGTTLNVYASAARGFETPTLNELFYSGVGGGFNFGLRAAESTHVEAGVKASIGDHTRVNTALFQVRTTDELVVDSSSGGRTSYKNAGKTLRQGAELSLDTTLAGGFTGRLALTALRAVYDQGFGNVQAGSRLPGVPNANLFAELAWKDPAGRLGAAVESVANSRIYAEDANSEIPAPGYAIINARLTANEQMGAWRFKQFVRVNNLADRKYVGSLIVGDTNKRYYEAAPGRNWMLGASVAHVF
ncbi:TonB-dependent receptor [Massilia sp. R2A-15]|uniref:TonB-dependent receptor family protein n=1 Tax=Massilia sp. R2A-15 TaxID=3064278 RepID=UPI002732669C|nr:TonB-dependent receptor [Massilia sp. R2A-15]WLI89649.1 TonB-dependent receptor [Massilia sp. R2A-15]